MKLLIIKFADGSDLSAFPWDKEVTVTEGTVSIRGKIVTPVGPLQDPSSFEGVYQIVPVIPPTVPPTL